MKEGPIKLVRIEDRPDENQLVPLEGPYCPETFSDQQWENVEPTILEIAEQAYGPAHQNLRATLAPRATMLYETDTMKVTWELNGIGDAVNPTCTVFVRSGRTADWTQLQGAQSFKFSLDINDVLPQVTLTMVPL
jgi:hypothetical protein